MDKDNTVNVEALLQSPGIQALEDPITLDVLGLIHISSQRDCKRGHSSTGSLAEKPPRSKFRMSSSQTADGACAAQPQCHRFGHMGLG